MILSAVKNGDEVNLGTEGVIEASIDTSSLPFLYKLATKNQYSDPVGSIIRELVSNAYDATTEAGSDNPVILELTGNVLAGGHFRVIDKGVGMSPDRIRLYMKWYSSSKREDNVQIGGFGIGGKSPLAYTSFYFIDTVHDGVLYNYIVSEGETIPECLLLSSETTDLPNGTTVNFEVLGSDLRKFISAIPRQLCYFDNVWVNDLTTTHSIEYDNEGIVYDTDLFKFAYNNVSTELQNLHVLIDKVAYPINFSIIKESVIAVPFGLKFGIGELEVTPSRENLMYTDAVIEKIKAKILILRKFVYDRYAKQDTTMDDLLIYIKYRNSKVGTMVLGNKLFDITTIVPKNRLLNYKYRAYPDYEHVITFDRLFEVTHVRKGKIASTPTYWHSDRLSSYIFYNNGELNNYSNLYLREGTLAKAIKLSLPTYVRNHYGERNLIRGRKEDNWYERVSRTKKSPVGWSYRVWKSVKLFKEYAISRMRKYPHPTEDWIEEYKAEMRAKRKSSVTPKGKVFGYTSPGNKYTFELEELSKKGIIFYAIDTPSAGREIIELLRSYDSDINAKGKFCEKFMFFSVSETQYKNLKVLKNLVHVDDFYKVKALKKMFSRLYYMDKIRQKLIKPNYRLILVKRSSNYYYELHRKLSTLYGKYSNSLNRFYKHEAYIKPTKRWSASYAYLLKEVKEFNDFYRLNDFFNHVDTEFPDKYLNKLIKGKHLNKYNHVEEKRIEESSGTQESGTQESSGNEIERNEAERSGCEETRSSESTERVESINSVVEASGAEFNSVD